MNMRSLKELETKLENITKEIEEYNHYINKKSRGKARYYDSQREGIDEINKLYRNLKNIQININQEKMRLMNHN